MSFFMPLPNNQLNSKPMAISSITTVEYNMSPSPSSSSQQSDTVSPTISLSPPSSDNDGYFNKANMLPPPRYHFDLNSPLSLQERRLRNKTASAKYRAKKNQQHCEMRSMIASLTKDNELLLRQLEHLQHENHRLKATCDKLRGKMLAQKMLKQYLIEEKQEQKINLALLDRFSIRNEKHRDCRED